MTFSQFKFRFSAAMWLGMTLLGWALGEELLK